MLPFLLKLIFWKSRPKIVIVTGRGSETAAEAIFQILHKNLRKNIKKIKRISLTDLLTGDILILELDAQNLGKAPVMQQLKLLIPLLSSTILVITHLGEFHPDYEVFAGEENEAAKVTELARYLPSLDFAVLNYDDETVRDIKNKTLAHSLTFGLGVRADFQASDILVSQKGSNGKTQKGVNFKINYRGNTIPVWLNGLFGREQVYASLVAASVSTIFALNLIEVSEALKEYRSMPGKMQLLEGIKNCEILDDSASASSFSMAEALKILKEIEARRKIAVLGDVLGIGKYSVEAHEAIGECVAGSADVLFTVGSRAKFIAQGASVKGLPSDQIFQYDTVEETINSLRSTITEGDLILVDGSKEMQMGKIVEEIKLVKSRNF